MENLKNIRISHNLTQKELAEELGIKRSTYNGYEQGISEPTIETLKKIADHFDVSLDYLCDRQNKNIVRFDSLSEPKKQLLEMIMPMSDEQIYSLIGYAARLKEYPIEDIIEKIKKGV